MSGYSVAFTLYGSDPSRALTLDGVIDTGATFTVVPAPVLDAPGIPRAESALFSLADGSIQELSIGYGTLELQGYTAPVKVVFGSDRRKTLIGWTSLEALRLAIDPVHQRLLPVDRIVLLPEEDTL